MPNLRHNIREDGTLDGDARIEDGELDIEVLYTGGGNCVLLCRMPDLARDFTWRLSLQVLQTAPGMSLDIYSTPYHWGNRQKTLGQTVADALDNLKRERSRQARVSPLLGLGVTVMCGSTALPAVEMFTDIADDQYPMSAEVAAKIHARDDANDRLQQQLGAVQSEFPLDFDKISVGEYGLMAVIHADGDGMGKRIAQFSEIVDPREYIKHIRAFSDGLNRAGLAALETTIKRVVDLLEQNEGILGRRFAGKRARLELKDALLPIRPLVFGGDDLTLVCDGRLGIAFALLYVDQFQKQTEIRLGEALTSSAGVAIVKPHYPFARAYGLAEMLARSAKNYKRQQGLAVGCIDWHFTTSGIYDALEGIRAREYTVPAGNLTLRPLVTAGDGLKTWKTIAAQLEVFQGQNWMKSRNKLHTLYGELRGGADAVREFYSIYEGTPRLPALDHYVDGWSDTQCGYADALELADFYIPLDEGEMRRP